MRAELAAARRTAAEAVRSAELANAELESMERNAARLEKKLAVVSRALESAVALVGTLLTLVGIPGLHPLRWWQVLTVFGYSLVVCLVVNDAIKVGLIRWRVPQAVA
jgi:hypothetical protein